jgi:two-component sensor histidine kinase
LADTHSLLTDDYWQTASLQQMLEGELRHYENQNKPRIVVAGPNVFLVADIAIPVGMAFHELASNSAKFGALSRPNGRLDVHWSVARSADTRVVNLDWHEHDGPTVQPPKRRGFGTTLLEKVLTVQCDAKVKLDYRPGGLVFTMALPLRDTRLVPSYY